IDFLDIRHNGRNKNELWRAYLTSAHSGKQQFESDSTCFAVEEVPLIANYEGDTGKEGRLCTKQARQRFRRRHDDPRIIKISHLIAGGDSSTVDASGWEPHSA